MGVRSSFFSYLSSLKVKLGVFQRGYTVAMITYLVKKTLSIFLIPLFLHKLTKSGSIDSSKYKYWNVTETVTTHLKWESLHCHPAPSVGFFSFFFFFLFFFFFSIFYVVFITMITQDNDLKLNELKVIPNVYWELQLNLSARSFFGPSTVLLFTEIQSN